MVYSVLCISCTSLISTNSVERCAACTKEFTQDVSKGIKATFSGAGEKEGFFESVKAMTGTSFEQETADSSKSVEPTPVFESTDSEKVTTLAPGTIQEGAYTGSSQSYKSCLCTE